MAPPETYRLDEPIDDPAESKRHEGRAGPVDSPGALIAVPLLVVVKKPNADVSAAELLQFFDGRIAKWQIPDDVALFIAGSVTTTSG